MKYTGDVVFERIAVGLYRCVAFRFGGYAPYKIYDEKDVEAYSRVYNVEII
jgi:hypothetical protein